MKILIADDEKLARMRLRSLLIELDEPLEVVAEATNGYEALQQWKLTQADVLLLDIRMPQMDGLQAAGELLKFEHPPAVIFTTAYDNHALQAFEANAIDYLLKPIRKERLLMALQKAQIFRQAQWQLLQPYFSDNQRNYVCANLCGDLHLIAVDEIFYFQAEQKYVTARTKDRHYLLDDSLKALEEEFSETFMRIHRNALVSLAHVNELQRLADGHLWIKFAQLDEKLIVSRRLASTVKARLKM